MNSDDTNWDQFNYYLFRCYSYDSVADYQNNISRLFIHKQCYDVYELLQDWCYDFDWIGT